jgi:hypothetical protein
MYSEVFMNGISIWVVPKHLKFFIFTKALLPAFILWFSPAFWRRYWTHLALQNGGSHNGGHEKFYLLLDITSRSPLKVNRRFRETCRPHLQLCLWPASGRFLTWLTLLPWRWRRHVPLKRRLTFKGLYGVTCQKTEFFTHCFLCIYFYTNLHSSL